MTTLAGQSMVRHIQNKDVVAVTNLLDNAMLNMDERDDDGQTFLMIASQVGEPNIVREILHRPEADVNAIDNDNWSALLNAAKGGFIDVVLQLIAAGADIEHRDMGGWTALMWACYKGRTETARELLEHGANPNVKGEHSISCLTWAAGRGHTEIARILIDKGAKVNTADKYGTTPLIWASRKGHKQIVDMLLEEGANVDNAGMASMTALITAAKGGYRDVVNAILDCNPNVNSVDKDGFTALTLAAKDGHIPIVNRLLQKGAYVNIPDRYGDTILIHAIKGGHFEVVQALLKKYADINVQGVDHKTALYSAVEKGHFNIGKVLLEYHADPEIANKDGDTPLLKAVRSRHVDFVQLLLEKGAKVATVDKNGDTCLHISVRGRSKRITEILLRNPKDSRLLYRPNKVGETPYQIDSQHQKSVLTQIFGTRNLNAEESIQGYDLYSSTIADVLSDPSLRTPITVGLYAKWGSGKSFLIEKLQKDMRSFTLHSNDPWFEFSIIQFCTTFTISLMLGLILGLSIRWEVGLSVGLGTLLLQYLFLGLIVYKMEKWEWAYSVSMYLARKLQFLQLLLQVLFCHEPQPANKETAAVKFLFTDNARLASVVGEKSIIGMIVTLCDALESEFGVFTTHWYRVFKPGKASEFGRFKKLCCVPYFVLVLFVLCCILTAGLLIHIYGIHSIQESRYQVVDSVLIAMAIIIGLALIVNCYQLGLMIYNLIVSPHRRIAHIGHQISKLKIEGVMQKLKKEIGEVSAMTHCMDAFLNTCTRLVVIVDGLDSCEQEKLLHVLDTVHMLFGDAGSPFITILTVDPHVVIKGIEHNITSHGLFHDSSITGHDYLCNLVHLPFFLQGQTMPPSQRNMYRAQSVVADNLGNSTRNLGYLTSSSPESSPRSEGKKYGKASPMDDGVRSPTSPQGLPQVCVEDVDAKKDSITTGSVVSLSEGGKSSKKQKRSASKAPAGDKFGSAGFLGPAQSHLDLTKTFTKNTYFSDINPKNLRRLKNIVAVTGRLLRAYNIDFNWYRLAAWINITEQWPYRLSWIIQESEDHPEIEDSLTLKNIYDKILPKIPVSKDIDPLLEIDRNPRKLEIFLANHVPPLSVGDMRKFLPCTINVDPYLRKLIREMINNEILANEMTQASLQALGSAGGLTHGHPSMIHVPSILNIASQHVAHAQPSSSHIHHKPSQQSIREEQGQPATPQHRSSLTLPPGFMSPQHQALLAQQQMLAFGQSPAYGMLPPQAFFNPQAFASPPPRPPLAKVHIQGGTPHVPLSSMAVEEISSLLEHIAGINRNRVAQYIDCLYENNISGVVLANCDMSELKPILGMSFGDWELFRNTVEYLRSKENVGLSNGRENGHREGSPSRAVHRRLSTNQNLLPVMKNVEVGAATSDPQVIVKKPPVDTSKASSSQDGSKDQRSATKIGEQGSGHGPKGNLVKRDSVLQQCFEEAQALAIAFEGMGGIDSGSDSENQSEEELSVSDEGITFVTYPSPEETSPSQCPPNIDIETGPEQNSKGFLSRVVEEDQVKLLNETEPQPTEPVAMTQRVPAVASVPARSGVPDRSRENIIPGSYSSPVKISPQSSTDLEMQSFDLSHGQIGDTGEITPSTGKYGGQTWDRLNNLGSAEKGESSQETEMGADTRTSPQSGSRRDDDRGSAFTVVTSTGGSSAGAYSASSPDTKVQVYSNPMSAPTTPDLGGRETDSRSETTTMDEDDESKELFVNLEGKTVKVSLSRDESFI